MSANDNKVNDRSRTHPQERFAPAAQHFDLETVAQELRTESSVTTQRHRQKTLYRHGQTSLALFLFEAGSELREHRADGTVFIQVIDGHITVNAQGKDNVLTNGQVLVLSPGVPHDLQAKQATRMLLTVCLEPSTQDANRQ